MTQLQLATRRIGRWRVAAIEAGRGVPVVFLHGSADSAFAWKAVLERLAASHRVCAVDFGGTEPVEERRDIRLTADSDLLLDLLADMGEPVHLVGHSYGALLALRFALDHAGELRSLCLTEPIAFGLVRDAAGPQRGESLVVPVLERFFGAWDRGEISSAIGGILDYWNGEGSWAATAPEHRDRILSGSERFHAEVSCAYGDRTTVAEAGTVTIPTLVASGANTTRAALLVCDLLSESIPGARSLRIPGAGHSPMRSHPDHFAAALRALVVSAEDATSC